MKNRYRHNKTHRDNSGNNVRQDALTHRTTGMGSSQDKLTGLNPRYSQMPSVTARQWYMTNGFVQNIINAPAEDATREWITLKTNRDNDDPENGIEGLEISRLIMNRLDELGLRAKIKDLIRFSRMYQEGGFLFWGITADAPQTDTLLNNAMPQQIRKLDFINVFGPDRVQLNYQNDDPLSRNYHRPKFYVSGLPIDSSRLEWMVYSYLPEERRGVSVIDTILDGIKAQDVSLWSVTSLLFEMSVKVFTSPDVNNTDADKLMGFLANLRSVISTQEAVALGEGETLSRIDSNASQNGQMKQLFDFIFDNLSGFSRIPKSRLMGNAQGVITAGQFDLVGYYDDIAKKQELDCRPIIEKAIKLVIHESDGEIARILGDDVEKLDWEFTFNPLWKIDPASQADIDLKKAQELNLYITSAVLAPTEVKQMRFAELQQHTAIEKSPVNMSSKAVLTLIENSSAKKTASKSETIKSNPESAESRIPDSA